MPVTASQVRELERRGFVLLPDFITRRELAAARRGVAGYFPSDRELRAHPHRYPAIFDNPDRVQAEFPYQNDALNQMATHPAMIGLAERLLGTRDVLLSRSCVWAKYAGVGDYDQALHLDYEGNTLVVPREDGIYRQINLILYYTDVTAELGPTRVVPNDPASPRVELWPPFKYRADHPELYDREVPVLARAGSLLVFTMSTPHRGSTMTAPRGKGARFTHHLVYRAAAATWNGYQQWSSFGEQPALARFLERATPRQREAIGFPRIGDPYWTPATLAGVAARYPRLDLRPYQRAPGGASRAR